MGHIKGKQILAILSLIGIDQGTKLYASNFFETPVQITDFFQLLFVKNTGIAFSIPVPSFLLLLMTFIIIIGGAYHFYTLRDKSWLQNIGGIFFLAGAIGNFLDRLIHSFVIDFLSLWSFPIFNMADIYISVGVFLLLLDEVKKEIKSK